MIRGYVRVSTDGQSVDAQVKQLRAARAEKVFRETASGARSDRAQLRRVLGQLDESDVLMVTRLDRLARSTITSKGAGFRSLYDTWADTTTPQGRLMLTVLGGLAEFERELIRARTSEGRERAKAKGMKFGRKPKLTDHQKREAIKRRDKGEETLAEIAPSYNVSGWTISRLIQGAYMQRISSLISSSFASFRSTPRNRSPQDLTLLRNPDFNFRNSAGTLSK
jgi:DNA invertase Pin-like site-specific DNA recombinase